jgi:ribosomal protein S18 acetylase RimI-like enzyme
VAREIRSDLEVVYTENTASEEIIKAHLKRCSDRFVPPLNSRVDLDVYSRKLFGNAHRIEAWCEGELVGLLACYADVDSTGSMFITNVSVDQEVIGKGVGSNLLNRCITFAESKGVRYVRLKYNRRNVAAFNLYDKHGFRASGEGLTQRSAINMVLDMNDIAHLAK